MDTQSKFDEIMTRLAPFGIPFGLSLMAQASNPYMPPSGAVANAGLTALQSLAEGQQNQIAQEALRQRMAMNQAQAEAMRTSTEAAKKKMDALERLKHLFQEQGSLSSPELFSALMAVDPSLAVGLLKVPQEVKQFGPHLYGAVSPLGITDLQTVSATPEEQAQMYMQLLNATLRGGGVAGGGGAASEGTGEGTGGPAPGGLYLKELRTPIGSFARSGIVTDFKQVFRPKYNAEGMLIGYEYGTEGSPLARYSPKEGWTIDPKGPPVNAQEARSRAEAAKLGWKVWQDYLKMVRDSINPDTGTIDPKSSLGLALRGLNFHGVGMPTATNTKARDLINLASLMANQIRYAKSGKTATEQERMEFLNHLLPGVVGEDAASWLQKLKGFEQLFVLGTDEVTGLTTKDLYKKASPIVTDEWINDMLKARKYRKKVDRERFKPTKIDNFLRDVQEKFPSLQIPESDYRLPVVPKTDREAALMELEKAKREMARLLAPPGAKPLTKEEKEKRRQGREKLRRAQEKAMKDAQRAFGLPGAGPRQGIGPGILRQMADEIMEGM